MKTEDFETLLQGTPLRTPPSAWRAEILQQARPAASAAKSFFLPGSELLSRFWDTVRREWLWPHPAAWASLAALWAVSLLLQWLTLQPTSRAHSEPASMPPLWLAWEHRTQQQRWITELTAWESSSPSEPDTPAEPDSPPPAMRPRSALENRIAVLA